MCYFQHRFSSSNSPRSFKHSDRSISLLFMFSFGTRVLKLILELSKVNTRVIKLNTRVIKVNTRVSKF